MRFEFLLRGLGSRVGEMAPSPSAERYVLRRRQMFTVYLRRRDPEPASFLSVKCCVKMSFSAPHPAGNDVDIVRRPCRHIFSVAFSARNFASYRQRHGTNTEGIWSTRTSRKYFKSPTKLIDRFQIINNLPIF